MLMWQHKQQTFNKQARSFGMQYEHKGETDWSKIGEFFLQMLIFQ
jgi:hypothetical protein